MRIFFAVAVPDSIRSAVSILRDRLSPRFPGVRWLRDESLHITLRFLGEVIPARIQAIVQDLSAANPPDGPFPVSLEGAGCFPLKGPPRVMWIGIAQGADCLSDLALHLEGRLRQLGFQPEKRRFSPHLTVGRMKGRTEADLRRSVDHFRDRSWGEFTVSEFLLMESRLAAAGVRYTPVEKFPLAVRGGEA